MHIYANSVPHVSCRNVDCSSPMVTGCILLQDNGPDFRTPGSKMPSAAAPQAAAGSGQKRHASEDVASAKRSKHGSPQSAGAADGKTESPNGAAGSGTGPDPSAVAHAADVQALAALQKSNAEYRWVAAAGLRAGPKPPDD